jgi:hypothetical protein
MFGAMLIGIMTIPGFYVLYVDDMAVRLLHRLGIREITGMPVMGILFARI